MTERVTPLPGEVFLPVPGRPLYEVSNFGRVASIGRWVDVPPSRKSLKGHRAFFSAHVLRTNVINSGYEAVVLRDGHGKDAPQRNHLVHRIVALAGHIPAPTLDIQTVVHHKDGNRLNNHATNLEWTTQADNLGRREKAYYGPLGVAHRDAKLTPSDVVLIRQVYAAGEGTYRSLAARFGVGATSIRKVINRESWAHVS